MTAEINAFDGNQQPEQAEVTSDFTNYSITAVTQIYKKTVCCGTLYLLQ